MILKIGYTGRIICAVWISAVASLWIGCSSEPKDKWDPGEIRQIEIGTISFPFSEDFPTSGVFPEYRIRPDDLLDVLYQIDTTAPHDDFRLGVDHSISVYFVHAPELNQEQNVRPNGMISLPYLGEVHVVGLSVSELREKLEIAYADILRNPEIFVTVPEFYSAIKELKTDLHTAPRGLSRLVTVRPDGKATFFKLQDVTVANRTIQEVSDELNQRYKALLPGLTCDLFLEKHTGSLVYVLGDVQTPDAYEIVKPIPVVKALAMANGPLTTANLRDVVVVRRHENKMVAKKLDIRKFLDMESDTDIFFLAPDDIVYVPRRGTASWAELSQEIADILMFRGWGFTFGYDLDDNYN